MMVTENRESCKGCEDVGDGERIDITQRKPTFALLAWLRNLHDQIQVRVKITRNV